MSTQNQTSVSTQNQTTVSAPSNASSPKPKTPTQPHTTHHNHNHTPQNRQQNRSRRPNQSYPDRNRHAARQKACGSNMSNRSSQQFPAEQSFFQERPVHEQVPADISFSRARTNILPKLNSLLGRSPGIRGPVLCCFLKPIAFGLLQIGVSKEKVDIVSIIPDDILICVCQLADCCDIRRTCHVCSRINMLLIDLQHVDPSCWTRCASSYHNMQMYSVIVDGQKVETVTPMIYATDDHGTTNYDFGYQPMSTFTKCKFGNQCKFGDRCKFSHQQ